jgi:hypothetical protein
MAQPRNQKDVRRFVGLVNFYHDLYPHQAEILAPLTSLCGKKEKFVWNKEHNEAFLKMKQVTAAETMLTYPNFDEPFVVHTDASNYAKQQASRILQQKTHRCAETLPRHRTGAPSHHGDAKVFPSHASRTPHLD